jgi:hypothetical protein
MNAINVNVLVTVKGALSDADKSLLRGNGVVVVEADDPSSVRFLSPELPPIDSDDLFRSALTGIVAKSGYGTAAEKFCEALLKAMNAKRSTPAEDEKV